MAHEPVSTKRDVQGASVSAAEANAKFKEEQRAGHELIALAVQAVAPGVQAATTKSQSGPRVNDFASVPHLFVVSGISAEDAARLAEAPGIRRVVKNRRLKWHDTFPTEENFDQQWGLNHPHQLDYPTESGIIKSSFANFDINAPAAWDITTGSQVVVVAILDSGVDTSHPDLKANLFVNAGEIPNNGVDDDQNGAVDDRSGFDFDNYNPQISDGPNGHGTKIAGIIAASANNGGVVGSTWHTRYLPLQISTLAASIDALHYIVRLKESGANIRAANISFSTGGEADPIELAAYAEVERAGIFLAIAAGNKQREDNEQTRDNDKYPLYPANYLLGGKLVVAAADLDGGLTTFSHFGRRSVDIAAPGRLIYTTTLPNAKGIRYDYDSGTSFAAPFVAGAAALMFAANPNLTAEDVALGLAVSTRPMKYPVTSGGFLDVKKALQFVPDREISGRVTFMNGGLAGVTVTAKGGGKTISQVTSTYGFFNINAKAGTQHTLTFSKQGYVFSPATRVVRLGYSKVFVIDTSALTPAVSFSGTVKRGSAAVAGVTVTLTGQSLGRSVQKTTTTTAKGAFTFSDPALLNSGMTYTLTASAPTQGITLSAPLTGTANGNVTGNFTATNTTVSGLVKTTAGKGLSGVTVSIAQGVSANTDAKGGYKLEGKVPPGTQIVITPVKVGFKFSPEQLTVTMPASGVLAVPQFIASK